MVPTVDREPTLTAPWTRNFVVVFESLRNPVNDADRQVDTRAPGARAAGVDGVEEEDDEPESE